MLQVFASPSRYSQGPGATAWLGAEMGGLGLEGPLLLVAGRSPLAKLGAIWAKSFSNAGFRHEVLPFGGECCPSEIARGVAAARSLGARTVVGAGGGKALDTARAVAAELGLEVVCCPTVASTDAPVSALSIIYDESGAVVEIRPHPRHPALVLVDSAVIFRAPKRFLVAGMGDALSTCFEARACDRSGSPNCRGGRLTRAALALAELCRRTLFEDGPTALAAMDAGAVSPAFERIVEANTLLSGLGFESAGLAAAHAIHNGLTAAPGTHAFLHGEKVAFGTLVQLVLEKAPEGEVREVLSFCVSVGLPVTLAEIGLGDLDLETRRRVVERSLLPGESIHHEPFPVTCAQVEAAILEADALGRAWRRHPAPAYRASVS